MLTLNRLIPRVITARHRVAFPSVRGSVGTHRQINRPEQKADRLLDLRTKISFALVNSTCKIILRKSVESVLVYYLKLMIFIFT